MSGNLRRSVGKKRNACEGKYSDVFDIPEWMPLIRRRTFKIKEKEQTNEK